MKVVNKKLLITCTDLMMYHFLVPHVNFLASNGFDVTIACSEVGNVIQNVKANLDTKVQIYTVSLCRSPFKLKNIRGYLEIKELLDVHRYDVVWTNEPVMGVITRLAGKKARLMGTKIIYMSHGFHFYKGAPKLNWLACPIEIFMSCYNDVLITINWEDYHWAKKYLKTKEIYHINGIGIDYDRRKCNMSREAKRKELGIKDEELLILSVGELQKRKNHEPMVRAVAAAKNKKIRYYICGVGKLGHHLKRVADKLGIDDHVKLLGYRKDVPELMMASDIYAHPSLREGLGLAALEAMASGLPLITSDVQGIPDYVEDGVNGFMSSPKDIEGFRKSILRLVRDPVLRKNMGTKNLEIAKKYDIKNIKPVIMQIIKSVY